MTDTANMMGAFPFVSAVMNHNKAAQKNAALVESGEEPTETEMKPMRRLRV
jgi:DNA polymerase-3 subunit alpha